MRKLTNLAVGALVLGAVAVTAGASGPAMAAEGKAAIEMRIKFMKHDILGPYKVLKNYAKKDMGTSADVANQATMLSAAAMKITGLFPQGTSRGDFDAKTTRALPKIWQDWKGFEAAAKVLASESAKLATIAASGDKAAIGKQFGVTAKMGCGGCHKPFRGAKEK